MIAFSCFHCHKPLQIKDDHAGRKAKCPHCAATILIPTSSVSNPVLPVGGTRVLPDKPAQKKPAPEETLGEKATASRQNDDTIPPGAAGPPGYEFLAPPQAADEMGRLGSYRVLKVLGAGGMGIVFLAEDAKLDRLVALKAMKPAQANTGDARMRFLREAKATAAIKHDHIVVIHQVDEDRGAPFLAMELLEGEPLNERIQRELILPMSEVLRIGREIAEGLAAAHQRGLIHRDVKPANIWLEGERARVKILDFGLARIAADDTRLTQAGAIVGTPAYMAPEQAQALPLDARCDLFSLGCVLYAMCTGQLPFKGADTMSILLALVTEKPQPPHEVNAEVSSELSQLILQLLAKNRDERPASAKAVVQALRKIENDVTQPMVSMVALLPQKQSGKRRRWPVVAALVVVLLAGGAGAAGLYFKRVAVPTLPSTKPTTVEERLKAVADLPPDQQAAEVAALLKEFNPDFDGNATPKIENGIVTGLAFVSDEVTDLSPVRSLPGLLSLSCNGSAAGKGKLTDLTPLKDLKLTELNCQGTQVADLSPLKDLKLTRLNCADTAVTDVSPLAAMPLQQIRFDLKSDRDADALRGVKTLEKINDKPAAVFWKEIDTKAADFEAWVKTTAALKAESQIEAVTKKLRELNPAFDTKVTHKIESGAIVQVVFVTDRVADLSPLRPLTKLHTLFCNSTTNGRLADLAPLKDLPLTALHFHNTRVTDLAPLKDMRLKVLDCGNTRVADLSVLKGMPLTTLLCYGTPVADLTPLRGMPLYELRCELKCERDIEVVRGIKTLERIGDRSPPDFWREIEQNRAALDAFRKWVPSQAARAQVTAVAGWLKEHNPGFDGKVAHKIENGVVTELSFSADFVTDLGALRALPGLKQVVCTGSAPGRSKLSDLSPLAGLALTKLDCSNTQVYDLSPLKTAKLAHLICNHTQVADLSPLRTMPLTTLRCANTPLSDLSPLRDHKLTSLYCSNTKVTDVSPLKGMPLTLLVISSTGVSDLTPLKELPLKELHCSTSPVADLMPLRGMSLTTLTCYSTQVVDLTPLKDLKLTSLRCDVRCERDSEILRSLKSLERINDKPAADYWKEADARHADFEAWRKSVAALKPEEQFAAVFKKLQQLNPDFDAKELHGIDGKTGTVSALTFNADEVTDLSPLRALTGLKSLNCAGNGSAKGKLSDLSPLRDLKLTNLDCQRTHVFDLSPLKGMPLTSLKCGMTLVKDLSPLKEMKLTSLRCGNTPVSDLTPLRGMPLKVLGIQHTKATDLVPLKEMPLTELNCDGMALTDLSPLKGQALKVISLDYKRERDADILHGMKSLEQINGKSPAEFWKEVEGK